MTLEPLPREHRQQRERVLRLANSIQHPDGQLLVRSTLRQQLVAVRTAAWKSRQRATHVAREQR
eukprot:406984-Prymnesium_polylepis.1